MDVAVFFCEVASQALALVIAAVVTALITWRLAICVWKPHLSVEQSASWRWIDDETFCITVSVRYRNTSSYRKIRVPRISAELQQLAPLSSEQVQKVKDAGGKRQGLPFLAELEEPRTWEKEHAPIVEPGESESEIFVFFLPKEKAVNLESFIVYTFIHKEKKSRGWGVATSHDIL